MSVRITIVMNDKIHKKLRSLQSKSIVEENGSHSFSRIVNEVLEKGLK
jgi:hypothetical protein